MGWDPLPGVVGDRQGSAALPKSHFSKRFSGRVVTVSDAPKPPPAPRELAKAGKRLWRSVVTSYGLTDADLEVLRVAAMAADRLDQAQARIAEEGVVIPGRFGNPVTNPASAIAKEASATINASMKLLDLPDPGGPPKGRQNAAKRSSAVTAPRRRSRAGR